MYVTSEIRHTSGKNKEIGLFTQFYQKHFFYFTGNVFDLFNTVIYQKLFFYSTGNDFDLFFTVFFPETLGFLLCFTHYFTGNVFDLIYTVIYRKRFFYRKRF